MIAEMEAMFSRADVPPVASSVGAQIECGDDSARRDQDLKHGESILSCESCQRILYYNGPQAVEVFDGGTRVAMS